MTEVGPALWVSFVDDLGRGLFFGCLLGRLGGAESKSRLAGEVLGRQRRRWVNQSICFHRFSVLPLTGVVEGHSVIQMPATLDYRRKLLLALRPEIQEFPL